MAGALGRKSGRTWLGFVRFRTDRAAVCLESTLFYVGSRYDAHFA